MHTCTVDMDTHMHTLVCIHTCAHTCTRVHMYTHAQWTCTYGYAYTHMHSRHAHTDMYIHMHSRHAHTHAHKGAHIHTCTVDMHTWMCAHTYTNCPRLCTPGTHLSVSRTDAIAPSGLAHQHPSAPPQHSYRAPLNRQQDLLEPAEPLDSSRQILICSHQVQKAVSIFSSEHAQ